MQIQNIQMKMSDLLAGSNQMTHRKIYCGASNYHGRTCPGHNNNDVLS